MTLPTPPLRSGMLQIGLLHFRSTGVFNEQSMDQEKSADEHVAQRSKPVNRDCPWSGYGDGKAADCQGPKGRNTKYVFDHTGQINADFDQEKDSLIDTYSPPGMTCAPASEVEHHIA